MGLLARLRRSDGLSRVAILVSGGVLASAIAIMIPVVAGGGPPPGTANLWVDTNGGTCTRQSTPGAYVDAQACSTMNAAYLAASLGDTVLIRAGSYTGQSIAASTRTCGSPVTFGEDNGDVTITDDFDANGDCTTINDITINGEAGSNNDNRVFNVTWNNVTMGHGIFLANSENTTIHGVCAHGTPFGCSASICCRPEPGKQVILLAGQLGGGPTTANGNLTIDGVDVHDATRTSGLDHKECAFFIAIQGLTLRNSHFWNCAVYDTSVAAIGSDLCPRDILFENNIFEASDDITVGGKDGFYVGVWQNCHPANVTLRNNTLEQSWQFDPSGAGTPLFTVTGNLMVQGSGCSDANYTNNAMARLGGACPGNTTITDVSSQVVNLTGNNYHLVSGAASIGIANPANSSATDHDGCTRDGSPDAGAFEFPGC